MSTETAVKSTGVGCTNDGCDGVIMQTTEGVVGDGKRVTCHCSKCGLAYESLPVAQMFQKFTI